MAFFQIEFHVPFFGPVIKFVKIFLVRSLRAIYIMVSSLESNCRSYTVWNVVNVKKGINRDQVQNLVGLLMLLGLQRRPGPLLVLFGICRLKTL